jgi:LysM repeat protein
VNPIDPRDVVQRAEEARRRAEALARSRQPAPPAPAPPQGAPLQARMPPVDVVEKRPASLFGGEALQAQRTRLDAELDREQLAAALAPAPPPLPAGVRPASRAVAPRPPVVVAPPAAAWTRASSAVLGASVGSLGEKARWLEARASQVEETLAATNTRIARAAVGFRMAGGFLEKAAWQAGVARELSTLAPGDLRTTLQRLTAVRQQFVDAQQRAGDAEAALRELAPGARGMPRALQDVREIQQVASEARFEASRTESRGEMLAATETVPSPAALALGEEDLARIGSGLDPSHPPAQASWSDHMLNTVCDLARQQGGITDAEGERNFQLARTALGADGATGPRELGAVELAALLQESGMDLAKVDPNQLQAASRYVTEAASRQDQQERLRKTLDTFQALAKTGLPTLTRAQMVDELWCVARVPGHALTKLSDAELARKLQEVLATVNAGAGRSEVKIGKYNLKLEVGANGSVESSSCKKPGFFSKVWSGIKKVAPIALTALSFFPVTAPFARAAQGVISLVKAVQAKSLIGLATAGASLAGAGGAIVAKLAGGVGKVAATAQRVANLASSAGRALQGVSAAKSGNLVSGLANIGGAFATGLAEFAGKGATGLGQLADKLNRVSSKMSAVGTGVASFEGYKKASQAVSAAKEALRAAQASGDARAIAAAQRQLSQAENQKRAALIGGAAGAATAASAWADDRSLFAGQSKQIEPATARQQQNLRLVSQALGVAQGVAAKDLASAAVSGLAIGATLANAPQAAGQSRSTSATLLNDAANLAQAALGYYQAEKGRTAADGAVAQAQSRLDAARASGNPEAVRQAEADLRRAKAGAESALMGGIAAGESLLETARDIGGQHRSRAELTRAQKSSEEAIAERARLGALADDPESPALLRTAARTATDLLDRAGAEFQQAVLEAGGDADKVKTAREAYDASRKAVVDTMDRAARARAAPPTIADSPATDPGTAAIPPTGFASLRPPSDVQAFKITKGMTIWEVSQLTGVPEERIREFNAQNGNPLEDTKLQIGQQILVPGDPTEIRFPPKDPTEVRAMQSAALAAQRTTGAMGGAQTGLSATDAEPFARIQQQFTDGNWREGAASLAGLVLQGTPQQKALARQLLGQIEAQQLQNVQLGNTAKIQQMNEAVKSSTEGVAGAFNTLVVDGLAVYFGLPAHTDAVRTIANEKQAELQDLTQAVSAVQQIHRETGLTLYELGRVPAAELDATLGKVYPDLSPVAIATLRGSVVRALANPDVGAVSRANYSSFSWDRGLTQADTSFADTLLQATSKAIGSTVRQARSDAEAFKNAPGWFTSSVAHLSAGTLDVVSAAPRVLDSSVQTAVTYYADLGGVAGAVGGTLTKAGEFLLPAVTAPLTLADYRATDEERTRALFDTALFYGGGALIKAGMPVAAGAVGGATRVATKGLTWATRLAESGALGETAAATAFGFETAAARAAALGARAAAVGTRVAELGGMSVADAASGLSDAVLRQGTRAAEALAGNPLGRAIAAANERVLAPLARFSADSAGAFGRAADFAKDYFSLVNNFGKGPLMETGARVLEKTGVAEVQARQEARAAYDAIRRSTDDVAQIAKATGRSEAEIAQIKSYLFKEEHELTAGLRRFDPDPQIASAWGRLQAGTQTAQDLALLQHEADELMLMKAGLSQKAAHAAAPALEGTSGAASMGRISGKSAGGASERALLYRRYIRQMEAETGLKVGRQQRQLLVEHLQKTAHTRLAKVESVAHRRAFQRIKNDLVKEWETRTGQMWPRYSEDVLSASGKVVRRAGDPYDAHHVIESVYGGPAVWWNIHPGRFPAAHQGGIHAADTALRRIFE